jgi:hypothetical protein
MEGEDFGKGNKIIVIEMQMRKQETSICNVDGCVCYLFG